MTRPPPTTSLLLALAVFSLVPALSAQTWDAAADFIPGQNPSGAWSYGWMPASGTSFGLLGGYNGGCTGFLPGWNYYGNPSLHKNIAPTTTCCSSWSLPPQKILMHPGPGGERSVLRWTAPAGGSYLVAARFAGVDHGGPTSTDVTVFVNGASVWTALINGFSCGPQCSPAVTACNPVALWGNALVLNAGATLDFAIGFGSNFNYGFDATNVEVTITGQGSAGAASMGIGCGSSIAVPVLSATPPILGTTVTLSITNGPPFSQGMLFASLPGAAPLALGSGCTVYLDLATLITLFDPLTLNSAGAWSTGVPLPANPALVGAQVALQGLLAPTSSPLGASLTNGLLVALGY